MHDTAVDKHSFVFDEHPISTCQNPFVAQPTLSLPNNLPFPDALLLSAREWMLLAVGANSRAMVQIVSHYLCQAEGFRSTVSMHNFQRLIMPITMLAASMALSNSTTHSGGWTERRWFVR